MAVQPKAPCSLVSYEITSAEVTTFKDVVQEATRPGGAGNWDASCPVCYIEFESSDDVAYCRPCRHVFHVTCFQGNHKRECPIDRTPAVLRQIIIKVTLLGEPIFFSLISHPLGEWLSRREGEQNQQLARWIKNKTLLQFEDLIVPSKTQPIRSWTALIQMVCQDLLNIFDGTLPPESSLARNPALHKAFHDIPKGSRDQFVDRKFQKVDLSFTAQELLANADAHISQFQSNFSKVVFGEDRKTRVLEYLRHLFEEVVTDPVYVNLASSLDRKFKKFHLDNLQQLSQKAREVYLSSLKPIPLTRLARLITAQDTLSDQILPLITKIESKRQKERDEQEWDMMQMTYVQLDQTCGST